MKEERKEERKKDGKTSWETNEEKVALMKRKEDK